MFYTQWKCWSPKSNENWVWAACSIRRKNHLQLHNTSSANCFVLLRIGIAGTNLLQRKTFLGHMIELSPGTRGFFPWIARPSTRFLTLPITDTGKTVPIEGDRTSRFPFPAARLAAIPINPFGPPPILWSWPAWLQHFFRWAYLQGLKVYQLSFTQSLLVSHFVQFFFKITDSLQDCFHVNLTILACKIITTETHSVNARSIWAAVDPPAIENLLCSASRWDFTQERAKHCDWRIIITSNHPAKSSDWSSVHTDRHAIQKRINRLVVGQRGCIDPHVSIELPRKGLLQLSGHRRDLANLANNRRQHFGQLCCMCLRCNNSLHHKDF